MEEFDLWFAHDEHGRLYAAVARPGEPPEGRVVKADSVAQVYKSARKQPKKLRQVGICDLQMLGIE